MIHTKEKIKVMRAEDLAIQIGKEVQMKGMSIALFRLSNGDIRAVENRCPHKTDRQQKGLCLENSSFVHCMIGKSHY